MYRDLQGKRALVTGGSRGIGEAIVADLLDAGVDVWYFSRTPGVRGKWIECDLGSRESIDKALETFLEEDKEVDILVNNGGITRDALLMRLSDEAWDEVLEVNLTAAFRICRKVSRLMANQRRGVIINISSVVGISGNGGQTNYSASKAGLIGFSKSLAKEMAGRNVRVNVIAPGFIETEMTASLSQGIQADIVGQIPLKRMGRAHEVSQALLFLASESASYITGEVLTIAGGLAM
ncbi:MAG: 3-oxoacyl-ACP reductase FabG [Spirochaetales bacterium]|nr:3-oxoacyl-ACP reductase FabG [Spirochaetales bacterium]